MDEPTFHEIDMAKCVRNDTAPQDIIERQGTEVWLVPQSPISMSATIDWAIFKTERYVQIPLAPYLLRPQPQLALAHAACLGLRCAMSLDREVRKIHIATGTPMEQLENHPQGFGMRWFFGFAILLKKKGFAMSGKSRLETLEGLVGRKHAELVAAASQYKSVERVYTDCLDAAGGDAEAAAAFIPAQFMMQVDNQVIPIPPPTGEAMVESLATTLHSLGGRVADTWREILGYAQEADQLLTAAEKHQAEQMQQMANGAAPSPG